MKPYDAAHFQHERCKPFLHKSGAKGVLLLHGFTGSVAHMRPLGDALADHGYTVMGINLPGHGTTEADMAASNWNQWLAASRNALITLRRQCTAVTVVGLSMGGLLSLILSEEHLPDACVTLSTPLAVQNKLFPFAKVLSPIWPRVSWRPSEDRRQKLNERFDYGYSGFPTRKAVDLNTLLDMARKGLPAITCPVLAVQSRKDETIWPGSANYILDHCASKQKEALFLEDSPHVCTLSAELPEIVDAVDMLLMEI